jgi:hypothetical protein
MAVQEASKQQYIYIYVDIYTYTCVFTDDAS